MFENKEKFQEFTDSKDTEDPINEKIPRVKSIIALRMESLIKEQLKKDFKARKRQIC